MQTMTFIGGDVSKAEVCFDCYGEHGVQRVANRKADLKRYLQALPAGSLLAVEATNTYHQLTANLADALGIKVYVLNPRDIHFYASGIGVRAKTDPCDARTIARYLAKEHEHLRVWKPAGAAQSALQTLLRRRATVVATRVSIRQSLRDAAGLQGVRKGLDRQYAKALALIDHLIGQALRGDPALALCAKHLRAIPGVGKIASAALTMLLTGRSLRSADAAVAFVGLDPQARESGTYRGQRKLSTRGPAELRRLLYVAAMTTARNPRMHKECERHRAKGLAATAIYNIIARKLLRTAWSMLQHHADFDMDRFAAA